MFVIKINIIIFKTRIEIIFKTRIEIIFKTRIEIICYKSLLKLYNSLFIYDADKIIWFFVCLWWPIDSMILCMFVMADKEAQWEGLIRLYNSLFICKANKIIWFFICL
jgi:hypothetical protein